MKNIVRAVVFTAACCFHAAGQGRVYTADQTSNTVSVIDPATNRLLGVIPLGDDVPQALSPLYKGELLVHGLGFSPDGKTLDVVSIGSNSVTLIDTASNKITGKIYVGRSPHEAFFRPDGKEIWAAVRGEDYVSVIDPVAKKEIRRIQVANGPGMVLFRPDGKYAFVPSSFTPELDVVDTSTYQVVARIPQVSPFSPNLAVDSDEVWFTLKDSGKTQVISAKPPFTTLETLNTGPISNHVTFAKNEHGSFAYVSVGERNTVLVYHRASGKPPILVASIPTGDLPHGIWSSPDGKRVYVGLENGDAVQVIDALTNKVIKTIPVGQLPQALVYVPGAGNPAGDANLKPLGRAAEALHLSLSAPAGSSSSGHATVSVASLGPIDLLELAASGLTPRAAYKLVLLGDGAPEELAAFSATIGGTAVVQTLGPLKRVVPSSANLAATTLEVVSADDPAGMVVMTSQK